MSDVTREFVIEVTQGAYIEDIGYALRYGERREEIVRCRDCKYSSGDVVSDYGVDFLWCDLMELPAALGHFCGWGKRREEA